MTIESILNVKDDIYENFSNKYFLSGIVIGSNETTKLGKKNNFPRFKSKNEKKIKIRYIWKKYFTFMNQHQMAYHH